MRSILIISIFLSCLDYLPLKSQQVNDDKKSTCSCLQSKIHFDISSIEKIVIHPDEIISNPDSFWAKDSAYRMVKQWHKNISFPVPMDQWNKWMLDLKAVPVNERVMNPQLIAAQTTMGKEKEFNEKAIPYICSFLPEDCPKITTTFYFTTAIMASGFQMDNNIVIYGANADKDNLFIHELFHRGFNQYDHLRFCSNHKDSLISKIYVDIQNEGMATYVGYKALKDFPHCRTDMLKDDYKMFENIEDVKLLLNTMNDVLKKVFTLPEKEINDSLWQVGSTDRAYYVVGCFMAKTIDDNLGRQVLIETISLAPQSFLERYNSLVDENFKVFDIYTQK
ncbi:DUF5700 domain-containing putative Zn-dependent protease [Saccharicrinis sp. FJH2]|uniref:DUF5700 domain-containing putative Zn-dependent protease n=1 Tax=Saccharicrinis sp. FJH65 TaxID=3344659 RepID=UPI0035F4511C